MAVVSPKPGHLGAGRDPAPRPGRRICRDDGALVGAERLRKAEENFRFAERLRGEAEENFRQARDVVDVYLTRVAESRLLGVPGLQPLRRELLESALPYYESFVRKRAEDPALARELASAYTRLARINADLGRGGEAMAGYRKALEILSRRTGRSGGDDPRLQAEVARCHQAIGDVHGQAEEFAPALQSYRAAEAIWRKLTGVAASRGPAPRFSRRRRQRSRGATPWR